MQRVPRRGSVGFGVSLTSGWAWQNVLDRPTWSKPNRVRGPERAAGRIADPGVLMRQIGKVAGEVDSAGWPGTVEG